MAAVICLPHTIRWNSCCCTFTKTISYVQASDVNEEFHEPCCKLSIFKWWKICMPSQNLTGKKILLLCIDVAPAVFGSTSEFAILGNKEVQQASLWLTGFYICEYLHQKLCQPCRQFFSIALKVVNFLRDRGFNYQLLKRYIFKLRNGIKWEIISYYVSEHWLLVDISEID